MNNKPARTTPSSLVAAMPLSARDERVYRIVYTSCPDHTMTEEEALMIFRRGQTNNESQGITGCLILSQGKIAEILEGPREQCMDTFRRITADHRHSAVEVHFSDFVKERSFDAFILKKDEAPSA